MKGDVYFNPGSLKKCACGDISVKWCYLASFTFGHNFKEKCHFSEWH